jgi:hypothetical protein
MKTEIIDAGGINPSLAGWHVQRELSQRGIRGLDIVDHPSLQAETVLFSFRSPWPSFYQALSDLKEAGIPIVSSERDETMPLIVAGGMAMRNPLPMADFMDAIWIGDSGPSTFDALGLVTGDPHMPKIQKLAILADAGFYVPALYDQGKQAIFHTCSDPHFSYVISERLQVVQGFPDRSEKATAHIEVKRGCGMGCSFCVDARMPGRVYDFAAFEEELRTISASTKNLGYVRISFPSLGQKDFLRFLDITEKVRNTTHAQYEINIGSTAPHDFSEAVAKKLVSLGQKTMTFAPEVAEGSYEGVDLRRTHKKWLTDAALIRAIGYGVDAGMDQLALYHLTGFAGETDAHSIAFARLIATIQTRYPQISAINIATGPVYPTVGTRLEHDPQIRLEDARHRWEVLHNELRDRQGVKTFWVLDLPAEIRYTNDRSTPDTIFAQALVHRSPGTIGKVFKKMIDMSHGRNDYANITIAEFERLLMEAGMNPSDIYTGTNMVASGDFEHADTAKSDRESKKSRLLEALNTFITFFENASAWIDVETQDSWGIALGPEEIDQKMTQSFMASTISGFTYLSSDSQPSQIRIKLMQKQNNRHEPGEAYEIYSSYRMSHVKRVFHLIVSGLENLDTKGISSRVPPRFDEIRHEILDRFKKITAYLDSAAFASPDFRVRDFPQEMQWKIACNLNELFRDPHKPEGSSMPYIYTYLLTVNHLIKLLSEG